MGKIRRYRALIGSGNVILTTPFPLLFAVKFWILYGNKYNFEYFVGKSKLYATIDNIFIIIYLILFSFVYMTYWHIDRQLNAVRSHVRICFCIMLQKHNFGIKFYLLIVLT